MPVFPPVFLSKEAEIKVALVYFIQVDGGGSAKTAWGDHAPALPPGPTFGNRIAGGAISSPNAKSFQINAIAFAFPSSFALSLPFALIVACIPCRRVTLLVHQTDVCCTVKAFGISALRRLPTDRDEIDADHIV